MLHRLALLSLVLLAACTQEPQSKSSTTGTSTTPAKKASAPPPPADPNNIVSIAAASKDHTTLVAALQAADYVKSVGNPGPLTVFAPTNAAFAKLPAGTLESLLKPEKQADLKNILEYHATTSVWDQSTLKDGMQLAMANGKKVAIKVVDGKVKVNDANIVASVRASNGMLHIIDGVLLPPSN
ncbi:MAG: fasciclin domain-containing protein [Planctomycetes bacterium]|nr:fasciclin domain-containing protein [Planctomycetota bacterium]